MEGGGDVGRSNGDGRALLEAQHRDPLCVVAVLSAASSLVLACAGSGILSFPWVLLVSRLPAFVLLGALVLLLCVIGMLVLCARATFTDSRCYERIMLHAFGVRCARATAACIVMQQVGTLVGFLVAIADFAAAQVPGADPTVLLPVLAVFVLWPLSLLPSLRSLWFPSAISIAALCAVMGTLVARAALPGSVCPTGPGGTEAPLDLWAWPVCNEGLLECVPILVFGFMAHVQTPIVACEVQHACSARNAVARQLVMLAAVLCALAVCTALYTTTAIAGVVCYGHLVRNDILSNVGGDALSAFAGGAMACHLALAYPIVLFPLLVSTDSLLGWSPLSPAATVPGAAASRPNSWHAAARSGAIVAFTVGVALVAGHRLSAVFAVLGGSTGAALVCWFPAALLAQDGCVLLRQNRGSWQGGGKVLAASAMATLGTAALAGTFATLLAL